MEFGLRLRHMCIPTIDTEKNTYVEHKYKPYPRITLVLYH